MFNVPVQAILLSVLIHALWGGNPIGGKFGLEVFPPFWSAFIRFVFGIATIVLWCHFRKLRILPTPSEWRPIVQIGLLFTVQIALMNFGFDNTSGVNASILISTNPLFAALFAHFLIKGDHLSPIRIAGLLVAFGGVCLTLWNEAGGGPVYGFGSLGDWLCLGSAALLGFRLIASANVMKHVDPFRLAIWQMVVSLPVYAIAGFAFETVHWDKFSIEAVLGLLYQGVIVAGIGFMVSLWLISRYRASTMTSFNFIAPVTGVLLAGWLLGERISSHAVLGVVLLAAGMMLITLRRDKIVGS